MQIQKFTQSQVHTNPKLPNTLAKPSMAPAEAELPASEYDQLVGPEPAPPGPMVEQCGLGGLGAEEAGGGLDRMTINLRSLAVIMGGRSWLGAWP